MKIAICDDEKQFIEAVCPLLEAWARQREVPLSLFQFTNGEDLIDSHKSECMDLIFLDMIMPHLDGMETAREIRRHDASVPIVFLSSAKEFAVDSYEVKAFQYLLKPLDDAKLNGVLDDVLKTLLPLEHSFTAQTEEGFCKIPFTDICCLEAQNKRVLVYLADSRTIEIRENFSKCKEVFSADNGFFCCHRSYIINLNYVEQFTKSTVVTNSRVSIPISRNKYGKFKEAYFQHMFG